jgi:hypothetical protein
MQEPLAALEVVQYLEENTKYDPRRKTSKNTIAPTFQPVIEIKTVFFARLYINALYTYSGLFFKYSFYLILYTGCVKIPSVLLKAKSAAYRLTQIRHLIS